MTNIVLNAQLPFLAQKQAYDNKVLFIFLILMSVMVTLGLLFVSLKKEITNNIPSVMEEKNIPIQTGEYV